jgi:hypothetical protein
MIQSKSWPAIDAEPMLELEGLIMNTGRKHWAISGGSIPPLGDETVGFLSVSSEISSKANK